MLAEQNEAAQALAEFAEGRNIIARLKEQSPDNTSLAGDLAWFDAQIAKLQPANGEQEGAQPEQTAQ